MNEARRKLLLDRIAAGQYNGIVHPSPETRRLACLAAQELYVEDETYAREIDRCRRERKWWRRIGRAFGLS